MQTKEQKQGRSRPGNKAKCEPYWPCAVTVEKLVKITRSNMYE